MFPMFHLRILAFAGAVGLTQADIARHLGITPIQVSRWSKGTRPLPAKHLDALWNLVYTKLRDFIASGKADVWPEDASTLEKLGPNPFRQELEKMIHALWLEYMELRDQGPSAWIESTFVALDALPRDAKALRKPANTAKLIELGRALTHYGTLLSQIGPIQDLLEETDHANNARESDESGSAGTANARDH